MVEITTITAVKAIKNKYPCMKAIRIAEIFGVSRERVRQILQEAELPTHNYQKHYCKYCGKEITKLTWKKHYPRYCSPECKFNVSHIPLSCSNCGKLFYVIQSLGIKKSTKHKYVFCSNNCKGDYLHKDYWMGKHPGLPACRSSWR